MKNQMYKYKTISHSVSQRYLLFVCERKCEFEFLFSYFLLFVFSSWYSEWFNVRWKFNTVQCTDDCNNRSVIFFFSLSFSIFFIDHKRETVHTNKQFLPLKCWPSFCLLTFILYIYILYLWKETEFCLLFIWFSVSWNSNKKKLNLNRVYIRIRIFHAKQIFKVDNCSFTSLLKRNKSTQINLIEKEIDTINKKMCFQRNINKE